MNTFKTNSRFASLLSSSNENKPIRDEPKNTSRNDNYNDNDRRRDYNRPSSRFKKDDNIKSNNNKTFNALAPENFPELSATHNAANLTTNLNNYSEKLKMEAVKEIKKVDDLDYELLNPGWIYIKKDATTGNNIIKSKELWRPRLPIREEKTPNEIFDKLVDYYYKREDEYIEKWGQEEWETTFKFQDYDYLYFDNLDEKYYKDLQDSEDSETNDDMTDEDYYQQYNDKYYD
jgi:hypothetical protein